MNRELILSYWSVGRDILARQQAEGWGTKVIDRLAHDLQNEFTGVEGFSPRSLKYMRSFAEAWTDANCPAVCCTIALGPSYGPAGPDQGPRLRVWYLRASLEYGWSRNVLVHQIAGRFHERQGKALTNFSRTLPPGDSDLAEEILKDPYNFDFLTLASSAHGEGWNDWAVWSVVEASAAEMAIQDLGASRFGWTCPKLSRVCGGDSKQFKFLLGHSSIQTRARSWYYSGIANRSK